MKMSRVRRLLCWARLFCSSQHGTRIWAWSRSLGLHQTRRSPKYFSFLASTWSHFPGGNPARQIQARIVFDQCEEDVDDSIVLRCEDLFLLAGQGALAYWFSVSNRLRI